MGEPITFERKQRLRLRPRGHEREVGVEVGAVKEDSLWVSLVEPAMWLEDHHLEGGVDVSFWRDGTRYLAEGVAILAFDLDQGRIQLRHPDETEAVQRRKTFRETVEVPVRLIPGDRQASAETSSPRELVTQDLGGGGVCLQAPEGLDLAIDDEVQLEITLPDAPVRARGKVRWSTRDASGRTRVGVAFTRITEREQDHVYGFLFELQRSRLRVSA